MSGLEQAAEAWIAGYFNERHLLRTRDWLVRLDPEASEAARVAALTHDIERRVPGGPRLDPRVQAWDDAGYLREHSERSARLVGEWLGDSPLRVEVERLVAHHETGDGVADLLQAADSLSFLEVNAGRARAWVEEGRCDLAQAQAKLDWMRDRIRVAAAREEADRLHRRASRRLAADRSIGGGEMEHKVFALGDFALQKGGAVIPDAKLGYVTLGELNAARDNVVVCPTWFTATPSDTAFWLTGPERALNPERWFIVIPNHFGAAVSSSPSNTPAPFDRGRFPRVTTYDNVVAQHRLLTEELGVERVRLVSSWSMGACQSYAWAALHPEMVDAIAPISGSARTANFNKVFLAGNIRAITGDANWRGGFYTADAPPVNGVRAMAALYAGWGFSEPFYRQELFHAFGAADTDEFIELFWDQFFQKCDANDLLAQMWTWKHNDLGDHPSFAGDFDAALRAIRARTIVIQAETDSYFPPVDSEYEVQVIPNAELRVIPTVWGHLAPFNPEDQAFIDAAIAELLDG